MHCLLPLRPRLLLALSLQANIDRGDDKSFLLPRQSDELPRKDAKLMEGVVGVIGLAIALLN